MKYAVNILLAVVQVRVTQTTDATTFPQVINTLQKGDYFGEKALVRYNPHTSGRVFK